MTDSWTPSQLMALPPPAPLSWMMLFSMRAREMMPSPPWLASPLRWMPLAKLPQTVLPRMVGPSALLET